ncbi:MAG: PAS domain S-box protein [Bacteroidales bacterium]|nr:PAS domain S-box protein [Bacteroidales bacterium]
MKIPNRLGHRKNKEGPHQLSNPNPWKEKYKELIISLPLALLEIDGDEITYCNEEAQHILEINLNQPIDTLFLEKEKLPVGSREILRTTSGSSKKIRLVLIREYSPGNSLYQVVAAETIEIEDTRGLFNSLIHQSPDGICIFNQKGIIVEWNSKMSELYEVDQEKYLNRPVWEFDFDYLPPNRKTSEEKKRLRETLQEILHAPKNKEFIGEIEKDVQGKRKYIQFRISSFNTPGGLFFARIHMDITNSRAAYIDLENKYHTRTLDWRKSEAQLRMIVSSVPVAFYSFEKMDRSKIWYSEQIEMLSGFTSKELMENPEMWHLRILKEDYARVGGSFNKMTPNEHISVEYRWKDAHDREIWIYDQAVYIDKSDKHPAQIVGCFMDISERKQAEISIKESEQNYREIFNSSNDAILIIHASTAVIEDANLTMLRMFVTDFEAVINFNICKFFSDPDTTIKNELAKRIEQAIKQKSIQFEQLAKRQDGKEFWTEIILKSINLNSETKIMIVIKDIDQKKKIEAQLRINEEKYRLLIEGQTDLIVRYHFKTGFTFISPSFCDLFEVNEEEVISTHYLPPIHEGDQQNLKTAIKILEHPPHSCYLEIRMHTRQGCRWIAWKNKAVLDEQNQIMEILAVGRDITNQKGAEEALRISEDRFRSIVQRLSDIIVICDEETSIIFDTPSISNVLGYKENYLVGQKLLDLIHKEDIPLAREKIAEILQQENNSTKLELRIKNAANQYIPMEGAGINLLHVHAIRGIIISLRDISERKLLDKKILEAVIKTEEQERERFAKNLHDDLGPLLSGIKMYISSLSSSQEVEKREYIISQLNEVVKEAITTTKEVSNDLSPHILINYGLVSAIENFLNKIPSNIAVNLECTLPGERYSNAIENSFYRIIKELINNSLKHAAASRIDILLEDTGKELHLSYSDNGKGMDMKKLDPSVIKGMGISNIISRAKSLNGKYSFNTKQGAGFSFNITISIHQPLE